MRREAPKGDVVDKQDKGPHGQNRFGSLVVREYEPADKQQVHLNFKEGLMEMIPDTAFRGLRHHPESVLLYAAVTVICLIITMCWWVIVVVPAIVLCARYYYSRRVIHGYLEQAMNGDLGDIEGFYTKSSGSCFWIAELKGKVVGIVAAVGHQKLGGAVELRRMAVDQNLRQQGIGFALGQKVLEFAEANKCSSVFLGTTAYTPAAHKLYKRLGFHCVGVTNGYVTPGARSSLLEKIFYRVSHHHYILNLENGKVMKGQA